MLLLKAFRNRVVVRLWLGQVGSSIGDEIYRMAFIWLAVGFIGTDTGYLAALQLFAVLLFGVLGGKWGDRWSPYRTMVGVDLSRAVITLTPVVFYYLHHPSFVALVISTVLLSGLGAFFEPAMQSTLPIAAGDPVSLKAANGLMSTTFRLARVMGPLTIGVLSVFIATIHFFTLNSLSYILSALSVFSVRKAINVTQVPRSHENDHVLESFLSSLRLLRSRPNMQRTMLAKTCTGGAWSLVYSLCMALLAHEIDPTNVKSFGMIMGAYGLGNVLGAILLASFERKNPRLMVHWGLSWLGIGFMVISITKSFPLLLLITAITAFGGPMNDLPFTDLVQSEFKVNELHKIIRLRMVGETFFTLLFMALSPVLFHFFSVREVIFGCGLFSLGFGFEHIVHQMMLVD